MNPRRGTLFVLEDDRALQAIYASIANTHNLEARVTDKPDEFLDRVRTHTARGAREDYLAITDNNVYGIPVAEPVCEALLGMGVPGKRVAVVSADTRIAKSIRALGVTFIEKPYIVPPLNALIATTVPT